MNRPFGRYGAEQSWSEWATTTSRYPNVGLSFLPAVGPLYAAKWAYDRANEAAALGLARATAASKPTTENVPADDAALALLERRLADYKVDPVEDESKVPEWVAPVAGGVLATLLVVAALRGISAPRTRRRR
jgi:hypothetical protein